MKECLSCKSEYEPKREASKFCSDKCRVKYHRKNGKKNEVKPVQVQALFNSMMDMLEKMDTKLTYAPVTPNSYDGAKNRMVTHDEPVMWTEPKKIPLKRTPAHWVELRRDCENADDYAKWLEDLENDQFLSTREKALIKQTV